MARKKTKQHPLWSTKYITVKNLKKDLIIKGILLEFMPRV